MKSIRFYNVVKLLFLILFLNSRTYSQVPLIQWQKIFGGPGDDKVQSIFQSNDGGFILAGNATLNGGDIIGVHGPALGYSDSWIFKLDSSNNLIWSKLFGGTDFEEATSVISTYDGALVFAGFAASNDGDVLGVHGLFEDDLWIVKIDSFQNIIWQVCVGGTDIDNAQEIIQLKDSSFIAIGETNSFDGDIIGFKGINDILLTKIDKLGNKKWTKSIGGTDYDYSKSLYSTADFGIMISGNTLSNDSDISGNHGNFNSDGWAANVDSSGNILWQHCYGGSGLDNVNKILPCKDGGFYLAGVTSSTDGDVSGNIGQYDYWLVRCDSLGAIVWQGCYGGIYFDEALSADITTDGGAVLVGRTLNDSSVMVGHSNGWQDIWVCKVDSNGIFEWGKCLGGSDVEEGFSIKQTNDGGYIIAGSAKSIDGDINVTSNHGGVDAWVVKLSSLPVATNELESFIMDFTLEQDANNFYIRFFSKKNDNVLISLYDLNGKKVFEEKAKINVGINFSKIQCYGLTHGMYFLRMDGKNISYCEKVIKMD